MAVSFARIEMLARREGISFREAARLVGRKGARVRREREHATREAARPRARYWWQRDLEDDAA
jgi:hypothetical protein